MARTDRVPKQARLTEPSAAAWERLCTRRGVTFTALIEALGEQLTAGDTTWVAEPVIHRARELDQQRHSRR